MAGRDRRHARLREQRREQFALRLPHLADLLGLLRLVRDLEGVLKRRRRLLLDLLLRELRVRDGAARRERGLGEVEEGGDGAVSRGHEIERRE